MYMQKLIILKTRRFAHPKYIDEELPEMLKQINNLNTSKHNLKEHCLKELKNSNSRYPLS